MHVAELWRFPVKSLRGERLTTASLTGNGVEGDRLVHIRNRSGVLTGRTRHGLLGLTGSTSPDGEIHINGWRWDDPAARALIRTVAGQDAEPARHDGPERFDVLPLLVATDGAVAAFGYDGRRLRPNVVIGGVPGLAERDWPGRALRIGDVIIGVYSLRARCVVTTIDPDTGDQDLDVLRKIHREFGSKVALNCWVAKGGTIRAGDRAELIDVNLPGPEPGGWITGVPYRVAAPDAAPVFG